MTRLVRLWLANRLVDVANLLIDGAWALVPADLQKERQRLNRLSRQKG